MTVSHTVDLFLEPFTGCVNSMRVRTDTTLDQDCVLKATVQVCTACMVVSLLTACMNFNTHPLSQIAPFYERFASQTRKYHSRKKLRKHVCQLILVCTTQSVQAGSMTIQSDFASLVALALSLLCSLTLLCSLLSGSFTVKSTQTCPPFIGLTQLAHPSRCSRSTLTTVCFCFYFCASVSESAARSIIGSSQSSCSGVWDPWSVECQYCNLQCCCSTEAKTGFVPTFAEFLSFLILKSSSRTCSFVRMYRISLCSLCCPAFNRSVKEFYVSPTFNAVTL